jgi:hypothetical protein
MPRQMVELLACWNGRFSGNDFTIVWNVIPSYIVHLKKKEILKVSMIARRRIRIYNFVFLNPSFSGFLLMPFSISLTL